jgi:hypothetical protein
METYKNADDFFEYARDRIYCRGEMNGDFDLEFITLVENFKQFINNPNYNIKLDLDKDNNNILHLIAKYSLYEFYEVIKQHQEFDNLKNQKNNFNFTPCDYANAFPYIVKFIIANITQNPIFYIPVLVSQNYYFKSNFNLLNDMKKDGLICEKYENQNEYIFKFFNNELSKRENISEEENNVFELIKDTIKMLPNNMFLNFDFCIEEKIKKKLQKSLIKKSCEIYLEKKKLNLDVYSESESENIIQDYDE